MSQYKIVVTTPVDTADALRKAIGDAAGARPGFNYTHCSYSVIGAGRFIPQHGAKPTIGTVGLPEEVPEERIEVTVDDRDVSTVVKAIQKVHVYEEPVIDIYPMVTVEEVGATATIAEIQERNTKVTADKAWETSWVRKCAVACITYGAAAVTMTVLGVERPLISALIPVLGYMLSTITLPPLKKMWLAKHRP